MMSGLPALPRATIRPSRTPTSALTTPQWSRTTAPVMTRSGAPSARVARPWPIDSRITLPPPKTASSPGAPAGPPQRSSVISIDRSVSASRIRSPTVGPYSCGVAGPAELSHRAGLLPAPRNPAADPGGRRRGTRRHVASAPGSKRTLVPAGNGQAEPAARPCGRRPGRGWRRRNGSASRPERDGRRC